MEERNKDFLEKEFTEVEIKKTKIAYLLAIVVIVAAIFIGYWFVTGANMLVTCLFVINILFGPVTLFFYLKEVRKGIFSADVEADMAEE